MWIPNLRSVESFCATIGLREGSAARRLQSKRSVEDERKKQSARYPFFAGTAMHKLILSALVAMSVNALSAADLTTALGALELLPKAQAKNLARIEAHDGTPAPERWHLLVHDKESETGLREFVIAGGQIVASRIISQFAESLTANDVMDVDGLQFDSDRAAQLAQDYALANNVTPASINYQLKKDGADAAPVWRLTCLDEAGKELGSLLLGAGKGNVISHDGFGGPTLGEKKEGNVPASSAPAASEESAPGPPEEEVAAKSKLSPSEKHAKESPGFLHRVGGKFQKLFTGRDTIGH
jgi:hypothetical protein